jgi:adenylylsulfate reductase subunit B
MSLFEHEAGNVPRVAYPEECWHCNACVLDCPAGAVELRLPLNYMLLHVNVDSLRRKEER